MVGTDVNLPSSQKSAGFDWNHSVAERYDGVQQALREVHVPYSPPTALL